MRTPRTPSVIALLALYATLASGANLLRNDQVMDLDPLGPSKPIIFTGLTSGCSADLSVSLDAADPGNCAVANPGEGGATSTNGSDDDDDLYVLNFAGGADPEGAIVDAIGRPLIFWQYENACLANGLRAVKSVIQVVLSTECSPSGACCMGNSSCVQVTQSQCTTVGGTWLVGGCSPSPCTGACCTSVGVCSELTESQCLAAGDTWVGGACTPGSCPGACCAGDGTCLETSQNLCTAGGDTWIGGSCAGTTCRFACCANSTLGCIDDPRALCSGAGETWFPGETCGPFQVGACCIGAGNCIEFVQRFCCERIVGGGWAPGVTCGQIGCLR